MQRKILVVDDEMYVTQLLAFILRRVGDEVHTADDGEQALLAAAEMAPDLIIADYQMPVLDGLEMCRRLRADSRTADIPVLILTARGHRLRPGDVEGTNVRYVLAKPFSPRELVIKVDDLIGRPGSLPSGKPGPDAAVA
jgi:DNA-binding response OmpR family regulator